MTSRALEILLVEDDNWDAKIAMEAFARSKMESHVTRLVNGALVLPYLRKEGEYAQAARPDLILLDLNLPKKDGREVLHELKSSVPFRRIPIVVLTTSKNETDIAKAYDLHANAYLNKPFDPDEYVSVVKAVEDFWFVWAVRPPEVNPWRTARSGSSSWRTTTGMQRSSKKRCRRMTKQGDSRS